MSRRDRVILILMMAVTIAFVMIVYPPLYRLWCTTIRWGCIYAPMP